MNGAAAIQKRSIVEIKPEALKKGMYVILPANWFKHSFLKNQFLITSEKEIEKLMNSGFDGVQVDLSRSRIDHAIEPEDQGNEREPVLPERALMNAPKKWRPEEIVPRKLVEAIRNKELPPENKAVVVKEASLVLMNRLLEDPSAENIKEAKRGIFDMVDCIVSDEDTSKCLLSITNHDLYTYTHSVNVGIFSLLLAKRFFKGSPRHNMRELGAGFFLHDLGKVNIDPDLINKPGRLNEDEIKVVRRHPEDGAKILSRSQELSDEAYIITMQHHERYDGSGYPLGLKGRDIHLYAKICSIADVYDALTSERSYKQKLPPLDALRLMRNEMIEHFQRDLFEKFVLLFAK